MVWMTHGLPRRQEAKEEAASVVEEATCGGQWAAQDPQDLKRPMNYEEVETVLYTVVTRPR